MSSGAIAFTGRRIHTMDPATVAAEAVVVAGDRIVEVGPAAVLGRWPDAQVVDLADRVLAPGFIDAHNHLSLSALEARWADLTPVGDTDALAATLRGQSQAEPDVEWIRGTRWEAERSLPLTRHDLDAIGLDRPVIVAHFSIHQCVVCSKGLEILGITPSTADPPGGVIDRDDRGAPTGVLRETAWSRAHAVSLRDYAHPDRMGDLIVDRARQLVERGITAIHDAACTARAEAVYRRLRRDGRLPLSVLAMPHPDELLSLPGSDGRLGREPTGEGDEWFRVGAVKMFADGGAFPAIRTTSAGRTVQTGLVFPAVAEAAEQATRAGFRVAVHAMGNVGFDRALDAAEQVARLAGGDHRFRIEHATLADQGQIERAAALGVVAVVQPHWVDMLGQRVHDWTMAGLPWMPYASLAEAGVRIAASSDDPCAPCDPVTSVRFGVTRTTANGIAVEPSQSVAADEWLRSWTMGAAVAGGQEAERGSISAGKRADLVVLDGEPGRDQGVNVLETWVAGRRAYERPSTTRR